MEHFSSKFNSNFSCFVSNFKKFLGIHFFNCVDEFGLTFSIIWIQWRHFFLQFSSFPSKKAFLPQFNSKKGYFLLIPEINICCINPFSFSAIAFMCTDLRVKFLLGQREGGALSHPVTTIHQTTMWSAQTFCQRNSKAMSLVWKPLNMKVHLNIRTAKQENGLWWGHACRPQDTEQIARWNKWQIVVQCRTFAWCNILNYRVLIASVICSLFHIRTLVWVIIYITNKLIQNIEIFVGC